MIPKTLKAKIYTHGLNDKRFNPQILNIYTKSFSLFLPHHSRTTIVVVSGNIYHK